MSFRRRLRQQRQRRKNLSGTTSSDTNGSPTRALKRDRLRKLPNTNTPVTRKTSTNSKPKLFRDNSNGRGKRVKQSNLRTSGGEFTLDGKPYIGSYHIMSDGRAMVGKRHSIFRKTKKYLEPVTQPTPPPTTTPSIPTSRYVKPTTKIPPKPAKTSLSGVINPPYKQLASYVNQYPATDTEVKNAANTNITSYYSGGSVRGHRGARESIPLTQSGVMSATVRSELNINFVLNLDGSLYTSRQLSNKMGQARAEGNWYYLNSIPVINFNSSEIPPLGSNLFKKEEDYAFNSPTNQIDDLTEKLNVIDWTCRKQAQLENPLPYAGRYDTADVVAGRLNLDDIIASIGKPPKIRWRQSRG